MDESTEAKFLLQMLLEDKKIQDEEFLLVQGDNQKTLELFNKRISLYRKFAMESTNPNT